MAKPIRLGLSPITNTIFAGRLNKDETMWQGEKYDVTDECLYLVTQYIKEEDFIFEHDGKIFKLAEVEIKEA